MSCQSSRGSYRNHFKRLKACYHRNSTRGSFGSRDRGSSRERSRERSADRSQSSRLNGYSTWMHHRSGSRDGFNSSADSGRRSHRNARSLDNSSGSQRRGSGGVVAPQRRSTSRSLERPRPSPSSITHTF